ncbi:MAG: hypothetical protein ABI151_08855, partial [Chitinophagaceae bacterium]
MKKIFTPFQRVSSRNLYLIIALQVVLFLAFWKITSNGLIPPPFIVSKAFLHLVSTGILLDNILVSLLLTVKALFYSIVITLFFSYLSVIPFFKSLAAFLVKCRYLTLTGLIFVFTLLTKDGNQLKLSLLVFGMVPFFVTSFMSVIASTDKQQY